MPTSVPENRKSFPFWQTKRIGGILDADVANKIILKKFIWLLKNDTLAF